jgi:membrane-associated phospholipid phosphatase
MKKKIYITIASMLITSHSHATSGLTTAGDILQIAIPTAAFGVSTYKNDREGQIEFATSFAATMAATYAIKYSLKNTEWSERPNGGTESFPSGHSSSAFGGAFFLQQRYGIMYGAPAIALAAFTGYTRVEGDYHHWRDVFGSMAIAGIANYFLVNKYNEDNLKVTADINKDTALLLVQAKF